MNQSRKLPLSLCILFICAACDPKEADSSEGTDASMDGGAVTVDAGSEHDASMPPANTQDASTNTQDAGMHTQDASMADAGMTIDGDRDGDGFDDASDPDPLDPLVPGDFSTPEAILADPLVQAALDAAEAAGYPIDTSLATDPPDLAGYYREADLSSTFVASGNGDDIGAPATGAEYRFTQDELRLDEAAVAFTRNAAAGLYWQSSGHAVRGTGDRFTVYRRLRSSCIASGSDYTTYRIGVWSGEVDPDSGNWVDINGLLVTIATNGELTNTCETRLSGDVEVIGGWSVRVIPELTKSQPSKMQYMCVDGNAGYVPEETWSHAGGESCECTTDLEVECDES